MGLDLSKDGLNVVVTAGTGILVFLDLVALMALGTPSLKPGFKLLLFYAVPNAESAIGLEFLQKFEQVCKKEGND